MKIVHLFLFIVIKFLLFSPNILASNLDLDPTQIKKEIERLEENRNFENKEIVSTLQSILGWLSEVKELKNKINFYQESIYSFSRILEELKTKYFIENYKKIKIPKRISILELEQFIFRINSQLLEKEQQIQLERDKMREIDKFLLELPKNLLEIRRLLSDSIMRLYSLNSPISYLEKVQYDLARIEVIGKNLIKNKLEIAQLSSSNRKQIIQFQIKFFKKCYQNIDRKLQFLRSYLSFLRQKKVQFELGNIKFLITKEKYFSLFLIEELKINLKLAQKLNDQIHQINNIEQKQRQLSIDCFTVHRVLETIRTQEKWLNGSSSLGKILRIEMKSLPEITKNQKINEEIVRKKVESFKYKSLLEKSYCFNNQRKETNQEKIQNLSLNEKNIYKTFIKTRKELLILLISGYDREILELVSLNTKNLQLEDVLFDIKDAMHRYMFWISDVNPIRLDYLAILAKDLSRLLSLNELFQFFKETKVIFFEKYTVLYCFFSVSMIFLSFFIRRHYRNFLIQSSAKIGKVTQDSFFITLKTVFWSIFITFPLLVLWFSIGCWLQTVGKFPMAASIGFGIRETTPILLVFMVSASFASPNGLFISHFGWSKRNVKKAMRYYQLLIFIIIPLMIFLIAFRCYNDRDLESSLGRFCFLLLCILLSVITNRLRRVGVPLYLDRNGSGNNVISNILWLFLTIAPICSIFAAFLGYLATSQELLIRLETSVSIWFFLLIIYYIIRRWMLIQRRKIAFERAKQRRAEILAQRAKEDEININSSGESCIDFEESVIDLDVISSQSLGLIRSILMMIALVSLILIWSELHSAFSFLENVHLWNVSTNVNGINTNHAITLSSLLIVIFIITITAQLIRNFPSLLELTLLQHFDLSPGSGYAIITLTKYSIALLGSLIGCSILGIAWAKLQWLVAAMGVGLGFGLQEIFANVISGLMILFERPIRIGDTVTIRDLTGSITRINTRATTLTDLDRKEIIVPNKAFITEQFINWSLSDTITRIVLTIPAPINADSNKIIEILLISAKNTPMILKNPSPEAYLVDLQKGIQIFELRIYAAEMGHRMPARHEVHQNILKNFLKNNITLPFPPLQARIDYINHDFCKNRKKHTR